MTMRVGIVGLSHESNTFSSLRTTADDFEMWEGKCIIDVFESTYHEIAGFIAGGSQYGFEAVPLFAARATPSGSVTLEAYQDLVERMLARIEASGSLDGILLALHGAMVGEAFPHADAETARRIRQAVGDEVPVVATHDFHANISPEIVEAVDALVVYKTNPHVDQLERGLQAASILARTIRGEVKPVHYLVKPDVLFNIVFHNTSEPPMAPLMQEAIAAEREEGILACNIAAGFQYSDVPAMGPSVLVCADRDADLAQQVAERIGKRMWAVRDRLVPNLFGPAAAVARALKAPNPPVALFEIGDNIGGGSSGDATFILKELIAQGADRWVVTLFDPEAAALCARAGIGGEVTLSVGGKTDDQHGPTLSVIGRVWTLQSGEYEEWARRHGGEKNHNQGLTAVLEIPTGENTGKGMLVLNSRRKSPNSINQIRSLGIIPEYQRILVAKGTVAPRAAYEPVCKEIIVVDTGGATSVSRSPEEFLHVKRRFHEWAVSRASKGRSADVN